MDAQLHFLLVSFACGAVSFLITLMWIKRVLKQQKCSHKNNFIYIENVAATCEKSTTTCLDCGKITTKTDC